MLTNFTMFDGKPYRKTRKLTAQDGLGIFLAIVAVAFIISFYFSI